MESDNYKPGISKLGLGCVTFGREIDEGSSFVLMNHAYANGITSFDTAAAYGNGESERILGSWLKERSSQRSQLNIATKILPPYYPSDIRLLVEQSLKRLGTEYVDILYLHRWDETITHQSLQELGKLVAEGKVKEVGVSNFNLKHLEGLLSLNNDEFIHLSYIQNNHNLAVSDLNTEIKKLCRGNNIRIITYSPLGAGFLTGKHLNKVEANSRFAIMPAHQDIYFNMHSQKRLEKLLDVAAYTGYSPAYLAIAWASHQFDVFSVLVGGRSVAHLDLAFEAVKFHSSEIFAELENISPSKK